MWLLIEWPRHADAPTDYWLSTLPEDTGIEHLVRLGKIRWRIEHDYRELKHGLGLDHFEGRSWLGWHHHTVLVTAAHLFVTQQRLAADPKAGAAGLVSMPCWQNCRLPSSRCWGIVRIVAAPRPDKALLGPVRILKTLARLG